MLTRLVLDELTVLEVAGPDRVAFLQGQLTQDVAGLDNGRTHLAGWADARGRLLMTALLTTAAETILMIVPGELAETVAKRLRLFVLRSKVTVSSTALGVGGICADTPEELDTAATAAAAAGALVLAIGGDPARRLVVGEPATVQTALEAGGALPMSPDAWRLRDIRAGLATISATTSGEFIPQMVNLDLVDAVSFTKGCYVGQEIVARTHYRGRIKRRMLRFSSTGSPPPAGAPIHGDRGEVGQVVSAAAVDTGCELLGVVYLDDLTGRLWLGESGNQGLRVEALPYAIPELATSPIG